MAQAPEHRDDSTRMTYDDQRGAVTAFLGALLMGAAIIGLFIFITWVMYISS